MQFTKDVAWDLYDFIVAGVLLGGIGLLYELTTLTVSSRKHRRAIGIALVVVLLIIWIELAVDISH